METRVNLKYFLNGFRICIFFMGIETEPSFSSKSLNENCYELFVTISHEVCLFCCYLYDYGTSKLEGNNKTAK